MLPNDLRALVSEMAGQNPQQAKPETKKNPKSENKTEKCSVKKLARIFNITEVRVQQLAKMEVIVKTERGLYDLWLSVKGYIRYLQDRTGKKSGGIDGDENSYETQRTRVYKARAEILEAQSQAIQGQLHDAACITEVVGEGLANLRAKMLAIPNTAGPRVADESDPNKCAAMIETLIHEALTECSKYNGREVVNRYLKRNEPKQEEEEAGEAWET
jgi:phage terminase Nu1 subunit (DNA packaging protein)